MSQKKLRSNSSQSNRFEDDDHIYFSIGDLDQTTFRASSLNDINHTQHRNTFATIGCRSNSINAGSELCARHTVTFDGSHSHDKSAWQQYWDWY